MASPADWTQVPTFSASQLLSATAVNRLEHDLGILQGVNFGPPYAFNGVLATTGGTRPNEEVFLMRSYRLVHRYDELHVRFAAKPAGPGASYTPPACAWMTVACPDGTNEVQIAAVCGNDYNNWTYYSPSVISLSPYGLQTGSVYIYRFYIQEATEAGDHQEHAQGRVEELFELPDLSGSPDVPDFVSGSIGSASDLNAVGSALEWLRDKIQHPPAVVGESSQGGGPPEEADRLATLFLYHTGCTLRYRFGVKCNGDSVQWHGQVSVCMYVTRPRDYTRPPVLEVTCDPSFDFKIVSGSIAHSAIGLGLDDGELYEIYFHGRNPGPPGSGPLGEGAPQPELWVQLLYETEYVPPANWRPIKYHRHGETPTASDYQSFKDNLVYIRDHIRARNMAVRDNVLFFGGFVAVNPAERGASPIYIQHRAPWLWYAGSGELYYAGNRYTLPAGDFPLTGSWNILNLAEIEWLPFGAVYEVRGASAAFESYFAQIDLGCE